MRRRNAGAYSGAACQTAPRGVLTLKRSNRLILLIGFVLAIGAFAGIFIVLSNGPQAAPPRLTSNLVVAAVDIPIGAPITAEMLATSEIPKGTEPADSFALAETVVGKVARTEVRKGAYVSQTAFSDTTSQSNISGLLAPGLRAIAVKVDQVNGVGTLIRPGDFVDVIVTFGAGKFPVVTTNPETKKLEVVDGVNATSVKDIIQNVQVVATLASAQPPTATGATADGQAAPASGATATDQAVQIVLLAVTAQQAEVIRFGEVDGADNSVTLVLRSVKDKDAPPDDTTGMTLRQLVDRWAVLPPTIVETVLPN